MHSQYCHQVIIDLNLHVLCYRLPFRENITKVFCPEYISGKVQSHQLKGEWEMVLVEDALNVNIKQIRAIKLVIMINTIRETLKKSDFL